MKKNTRVYRKLNEEQKEWDVLASWSRRQAGNRLIVILKPTSACLWLSPHKGAWDAFPKLMVEYINPSLSMAWYCYLDNDMLLSWMTAFLRNKTVDRSVIPKFWQQLQSPHSICLGFGKHIFSSQLVFLTCYSSIQAVSNRLWYNQWTLIKLHVLFSPRDLLIG